MISISDISVRFGQGTPNEMTALRNLSLEIAQGEFVTVIGSNGAGKSTLLNTVAGTVKPTTGQIAIDGTDVTHQKPHMRARSVARVFQDPMVGTCESLSIEENMALAANRTQPRGLRRAIKTDSRGMFQTSLKKLGLGLEHRLSDRAGLLSGGQRQAVSLLMATLSPSKILLLDEHTAALDPNASDLVLGLTETIVSDSKMTALMVTHSMAHALRYGTRLLMMHQGKIVYDMAGAEKSKLTVADLLALFKDLAGGDIDDDKMLLA